MGLHRDKRLTVQCGPLVHEKMHTYFGAVILLAGVVQQKESNSNNDVCG